MKTNTEYSNEWQIQIGKDIFTISQSKNDKETEENDKEIDKEIDNETEFFTVHIKKTVVTTPEIKHVEEPDMEELFGEEKCCEEENAIEENAIEEKYTEEDFEKLYDEINLDDIEF